MSVHKTIFHKLATLVLLPIVMAGCQRNEPDSVNVSSPQQLQYTDVSVSGVSSGAYMAAQLAVAYSSVFTGAGLIAGGPYFCAQNIPPSEIDKIKLICMNGGTIPDDIRPYVYETDARAETGDIDPTSNIAKQKIFIFNSITDQIINPGLGYLSKLYFDYYKADVVAYNALGLLNPAYVNYTVAHGMPTQIKHYDAYYDASDRLLPCAPANSQLSPWFPVQYERGNDPWLYYCPYPNEDAITLDGFPMTQYILEHLYGSLSPAKEPTGTMRAIPQLDYTPYTSIAELHAHGIGENAYFYIPSQCADGTVSTCKLHVALHGCQQFPERQFTAKAGSSSPGAKVFGDSFYNGPYNGVAEANNIAILYPQAYNIGTSQSDINPYGCWEFWPFFEEDINNYYTKSGVQMQMIEKMVDALVNPGSER